MGTDEPAMTWEVARPFEFPAERIYLGPVLLSAYFWELLKVEAWL